jgi:hypothetical protein
MNRRAACLLVLGSILVAPCGVHADLKRGTVDLFNGGFDFTTETQDPLYNPWIDIAWCIVVDPPIGDLFCLWNGAGLLAVPDSTLESITCAPPDISSYEFEVAPTLGMAYVMRTGDGVYLKFAVREFEPYVGLVIEYYVQKDGTNNLRDDVIVTVRAATWGRVKALYR